MRGMTIQSAEENRLCLVFNHVVDLKLIMDLRLWIFDWNLLILRPLTSVDTQLVDLNWCLFVVCRPYLRSVVWTFFSGIRICDNHQAGSMLRAESESGRKKFTKN